MKRGTRSVSIALTCLVALMAIAGLAWACTPQQYISSISPASAPAGTRVLVEGQSAAPGMVDILWDGPQGQRIGQALTGPDGRFSAMAEIPYGASPDVYSIAASSGSASVARSVFEVTAATSSSAGTTESSASITPVPRTMADLWTGFPTSQAAPTNQSDVTDSGPLTSDAMLPAGLALLVVGFGMSAGALVVASRRRSGVSST